MPNIQAPDGKVVAFPDSMSMADITAAMEKQYGTAAADDTPEWAGRHPNLYGMVGAGKALARTGIESAATTLGAAGGALIPLPGTSIAGAGVGYAAGKRAADVIFGEPVDTTLAGIGKDVAVGSVMQGAGGLIGRIPGVNKILSPEVASVGQKPVASRMLNRAAESVAEKTLKVPPSGKIGFRTIDKTQAINTMLEEGARVTKGGLKKVQGMAEGLLDEMDNTIASNPNAMIRTDDILGPVSELRDWAKKTVNGDDLAGEINAVIAKFKKQYGDEITVTQAQEIKQNTNAWIRKSYGELKAPMMEAQKQIVRGLRERIAAEIPEIAGINARYGELKNLEYALKRAVDRTGNWDWFSLSAGMAGTVVGGSTGSVMKASEAVALWRLLKSPRVQSELALTLKRLGKAKEANLLANTITNSLYHKMTGKEAAPPQDSPTTMRITPRSTSQGTGLAGYAEPTKPSNGTPAVTVIRYDATGNRVQ